MSTDEKPREWDAIMLPVMKALVGKKGIELRSASEVDKKKVFCDRASYACCFKLVASL